MARAASRPRCSRDQAVTNNTSGTAGPALLNASVAGKKLKMVFNADLDDTSEPDGSAFTVVADDLDGDSRKSPARARRTSTTRWSR